MALSKPNLCPESGGGEGIWRLLMNLNLWDLYVCLTLSMTSEHGSQGPPPKGDPDEVTR